MGQVPMLPEDLKILRFFHLLLIPNNGGYPSFLIFQQNQKIRQRAITTKAHDVKSPTLQVGNTFFTPAKLSYPICLFGSYDPCLSLLKTECLNVRMLTVKYTEFINGKAECKYNGKNVSAFWLQCCGKWDKSN
jgi:hypothetical protein